MGMLADVFNSDAFGLVDMSVAVEMLPQLPSKIGDMGLFEDHPIHTRTATVESVNGILTILQTAPVGTRTNELKHQKRKMRAFVVPHIPQYDTIKAEEISGVREFGAGATNFSGDGGVDDVSAIEQQLRTWATVVNTRQQTMKNNITATWEWHRVSALQGILLDADSSVIYNWFNEFGVTQLSFAYDFATSSPTEDVKITSQKACRSMQFQLGATPFQGIQVLCGDNFWDKFVACASVKEAYKNWNNNFLQTQQRNGFMFADMFWANYTAKLNGTNLIPTETAIAFPIGVPGLFSQINAPANFIETVNTLGKPIYSKQVVDKYETEVEIFMQSNPLFMCTRPGCLLQFTHL